MALSESEELELLELENKNAQAQQSQQAPPAGQSLPDAAKAAFQQVTAPIAATAKALQPKNLTGLLPVGGAIAGTALAPGAGTAAGAGLGSIAQRMADMAYGKGPPLQPTTNVGGIPVSPKEAIWPMANAAMAGIPETQEGQKVGQAVSDAYQSAKPGVTKALRQVGQMFTGKSAAKVGRIINDPTAILPESLGGAKSVQDASNAYGKALENTVVEHPGEQYVTRGLEKKDFGPFKKGHQEAEEAAQTIYDKWKAGEPVTAQEAYNAKRATDKLWPAVVKERNAEDIKQMSDFKSGMDDILSSQGGQFANVSKDYARARLKSDFTQILPRTKTGDISTVKSLLMPMLEPKKIPFLLATSPAMTGVGNLAGQGAMKGLNAIAQNPESRQVLLQVLQRLQQGQPQSQ